MDVTERKPLTRSKIGVLMGGRSSEREVSLKTGEVRVSLAGAKWL